MVLEDEHVHVCAAGDHNLFSLKLLRGGKQPWCVHQSGQRTDAPLLPVPGQPDNTQTHADTEVQPVSACLCKQGQQILSIAGEALCEVRRAARTRRLILSHLNLNVCRVRAAEGSALRALKEKLFTHRSELMLGFQQFDQNNAGVLFSLCLVHLQHAPSFTCVALRYTRFFFSGTVSVSEWTQVLETVLRLDLPWRTLRPHLVQLAPNGRVEYQSCFEDMEPGIPLAQVRKVMPT